METRSKRKEKRGEDTSSEIGGEIEDLPQSEVFGAEAVEPEVSAILMEPEIVQRSISSEEYGDYKGTFPSTSSSGDSVVSEDSVRTTVEPVRPAELTSEQPLSANMLTILLGNMMKEIKGDMSKMNGNMNTMKDEIKGDMSKMNENMGKMREDINKNLSAVVANMEFKVTEVNKKLETVTEDILEMKQVIEAEVLNLKDELQTQGSNFDEMKNKVDLKMTVQQDISNLKQNQDLNTTELNDNVGSVEQGAVNNIQNQDLISFELNINESANNTSINEVKGEINLMDLISNELEAGESFVADVQQQQDQKTADLRRSLMEEISLLKQLQEQLRANKEQLNVKKRRVSSNQEIQVSSDMDSFNKFVQGCQPVDEPLYRLSQTEFQCRIIKQGQVLGTAMCRNFFTGLHQQKIIFRTGPTVRMKGSKFKNFCGKSYEELMQDRVKSSSESHKRYHFDPGGSIKDFMVPRTKVKKRNSRSSVECRQIRAPKTKDRGWQQESGGGNDTSKWSEAVWDPGGLVGEQSFSTDDWQFGESSGGQTVGIWDSGSGPVKKTWSTGDKQSSRDFDEMVWDPGGPRNGTIL